MLKLRDMNFKVKLGLMFGAALVGMVVFTSLAFLTLHRVEIGSEIYQTIASDNDLVADFVPPPQSLAEVRRTLLQIENTNDLAVARSLVLTAREQEKAFKERHEYFESRIHDPRLRGLLDGEAYTCGIRLFELMESGYLPKVENGQIKDAKEFRAREMEPLYAIQATAVDEVVKAATQVMRKARARGEVDGLQTDGFDDTGPMHDYHRSADGRFRNYARYKRCRRTT